MQITNHTDWDFHSVEEIIEPERYLVKPAELLNELGVRWCFAFGTALGLYRDNSIIPRDTDVDIMILVDDETPFDTIKQAFEGHYTLIRSAYDDGKPHQLAFQGEDGFIVDLCFFYRSGEYLVSLCDGGYWQDKVETVGNFKEKETKYGKFPLPEQIEEYLKDRYGDWQTPRHGAITSSIKA